MAKYRKKPVVIDAEQFWISGRRIDGVCYGCPQFAFQVPHIHTLEGAMMITEGDYVITGIKQEKYPCKLDLFLETYEKVE